MRRHGLVHWRLYSLVRLRSHGLRCLGVMVWFQLHLGLDGTSIRLGLGSSIHKRFLLMLFLVLYSDWGHAVLWMLWVGIVDVEQELLSCGIRFRGAVICDRSSLICASCTGSNLLWSVSRVCDRQICHCLFNRVQSGHSFRPLRSVSGFG